ncbi:MAG: hypothetical protein AB4290_08050 [Spirulina sp.]
MRTVIRRHITSSDRGTIENVWIDDNGKVSHYTYTRPVDFTSFSSVFDPLEELFWDWHIERTNGYLFNHPPTKNVMKFNPRSGHILDAEVVEVSSPRWQNTVREKWGKLQAGIRQFGKRLQKAGNAAWYELTRNS